MQATKQLDLQTVIDNTSATIDALHVQAHSMQARLDALDTLLSEQAHKHALAVTSLENLRADRGQTQHALKMARLSLATMQGTSAHKQAQDTVSSLETHLAALQGQCEQAEQECLSSEQQLNALRVQAEQERASLLSAMQELSEQLAHFQTQKQQASTLLGQALYEQVASEIEEAESAFIAQRRELLVSEYRVKNLKEEASKRLHAFPELARQAQERYAEPEKPLEDSTTRVLQSWLDFVRSLQYDGHDMIRLTQDNRPFLHLLSLNQNDLQAMTTAYANGRVVDSNQLFDSRTSQVRSLLEQHQKKLSNRARGIY